MKVLVTAALPYANGDVHLGTLAGSNLPADIYARYLRSRGVDVLHVCGTDEHGVPITIQAEKEGVSPQQLVDKYYDRISTSFRHFGIQFDNFSRTSRPLHREVAQAFFLTLHHRGLFETKVVEQFHCSNCRRFLPDRYVEGTCPYCSSEGARGDQCDNCGRWLEPSQLVEPRCKICGKQPRLTKTQHWFFKLSLFQERLREWIESKRHWKENVRNFCQNLLEEGLRDRPFTRDLSWGVPFPVEGAEGKVVYVWYEALIGYISSTIEWAHTRGDPDRWQDYWKDSSCKLVHFIGKDNIIFHAIVWPAMLMGHGEYVLPTDIPANEFITLDKKQMSTSRNWAVWLPDYLEHFEPDPLRYALTINAPETSDSDFTWRDFQLRNNSELADIYGNFINRTLGFVHGFLGGRIPSLHDLTSDDRKFNDLITSSHHRVGEFMETFQLRKALKELMALAAEGNRYFDYARPWETRKTDRKKCETAIALCSKLVTVFSVLAEPFLPFTSEKTRNMLGIDRQGWDSVPEIDVSGLQIRKPVVLFQKVPDEVIDSQVQKLSRPTTEAPSSASIDLSEFERLDIRVAEVLSAHTVKGADTLLRLTLSVGGEEVEVVAGIAQHYTPEQLPGKKLVLLRNLKPAVIRGIKSQGMILAGTHDDRLALIVPDQDLPSGSKVS
ncbi:hypothetical protein AMJ40_01900 [candidate division TA06 bacterium DG_26]|uniref:Methionine--tRNA ligase n=1 Tax=candidate division TA06 bacterium DG_26 TaxID=1703771 RepID=A0A0S7WKV1_UNCT6|nr:MAG: hypothetical protein AMJ40_01900 [candidate division TA06 bacterium DG_26]